MSLNNSLTGLAETGHEIGGFFGNLIDGGLIQFLFSIPMIVISVSLCFGTIYLLTRIFNKDFDHLCFSTKN